MSARDDAATRERRAWTNQQAAKSRDEEDSRQYDLYVAELKGEQHRVVTAAQITPLDFERWTALMPDGEPDPVVRGAIATNKHLLQIANQATLESTRNGKDAEFALPQSVVGKNMSFVDAQTFNGKEFRVFCDSEPEFHPSVNNIRVLRDYLLRNGIQISDAKVYKLAFERLRAFGLLEPWPVEVEPEPEATVEPDPEAEWDRYRSEVVARDPRDGTEYSAYQLDRTDSETYRRLVFGEFYKPQVTDVIQAGKWPFARPQSN